MAIEYWALSDLEKLTFVGEDRDIAGRRSLTWSRKNMGNTANLDEDESMERARGGEII